MGTLNVSEFCFSQLSPNVELLLRKKNSRGYEQSNKSLENWHAINYKWAKWATRLFTNWIVD